MKNNNFPFVITLTGPSQSGKSLILKKIGCLSSILKEKGYDFFPKLIKKYTTREYRIEEYTALDQKKEIDVISVNQIPQECNLVYQSYGLRYGLNTKDIQDLLKQGKSPYVVINDIRAVEELKEAFPNQVLSLFIFRKIPDLSDFKNEAIIRGNVSETEVTARYEKAVSIYRMYIENIALFDKVILNAIEYDENDLNTIEKNILDKQLINIFIGVMNRQIVLRRNSSALHSNVPKTFILAGNAASGKDEIIRAIKDMGKLQAEIIPKYTVRRQEEDDEEEMICQYIPRKEIMNLFERQYFTDKNSIIEELEKVSDKIKKGFRKEWEEMKSKILSKILDSKKRFWNEVQCNFNTNDLFEKNRNYIDLTRIIAEGNVIMKESDDTMLVVYDNKTYIIYHAKGKKEKLYGCILSDVDLSKRKYRVLVASQTGVFNIFKKKFGANNVVIIYSHSQISELEFINNKKNQSEIDKKEKFNEYLNDYVNNIVHYDHVVIYAKSHLTNEQSIKEEELVDQMFRLFRVY